MATAKYFNRDLSWIDFNGRVLEEGLRPEHPALERLRFLSIVSSNFDEFFMVRIASIKQAARTHTAADDPSGLSPAEQLSLAAARVRAIILRQYACLNDELLPELAANGLELIRPARFTPTQVQFLETLFQREIFPALTPLRVTRDGAFPLAGNLRLHAAFLLRRHGTSEDEDQIAIVQIPSSIPRIVWLPRESDEKTRWALLDDVVLRFASSLFPGYSIQERTLFKLTRDADSAVDEMRDRDFVEAMEEVLSGRERSRVIRLSISMDSPRLRDELARRLALSEDDIYEIPGPIDLGTLMDLTQAKDFPHLRREAWKNHWPAALPHEGPLWNHIREGDVLLHHPYHSFEPVLRLFSDAAEDPDVIAIKTTLYRTSGDSPIIQALERAARSGKQVTVLVELKARFDEERNIAWASRLEQAGAIVVYGVAELKVHAKACLILRREQDGVRRYIHLSTGNYNDRTARFYADVGMLSANEDLAYELSLFFNTLTGYSTVQNLSKLVMAPQSLKHRLISLIDREAKRSTPESPGRIMAKMNSLADIDVINALYRASQAGVEIQLNVRGICMLVPGVPGLSERISVVSIIDRYLEHARIFRFENGGAEEVYLSSADWMPRNLERRIELMFPVLQETAKQAAIDILKACFADNCQARRLSADGSWQLLAPPEGVPALAAQETIYRRVEREAGLASAAPKQDLSVRRKGFNQRS